MKLIAGLGNPGARYARTRHNLGFMAADRLASELTTSFTRIQDNGAIARAHYVGETVLLVKPQTFMNLSGRAVAAIARRAGCEPEDILVLVDDTQLPLGKIRLRPGGSAGGHNGLKSIIAHLGSDNFARLRMGVGTEIMTRIDDLSAYVLSRFRPEEAPLVAEMVDNAAQAALCWLEAGVERTMNRFN